MMRDSKVHTTAVFISRLLLISVLILHVLGAEACSDGDVRLAGGPNEFEGRVEYCINSEWGHVCDTNWNRNNGLVVCRQLGYESSDILSFGGTISYYGAQEGPAFLSSVDCSGSELRLDNCTTQSTNQTGCGSLGYAYLVCQDPTCGMSTSAARLVDGGSERVGRVEYCDAQGRRRQVCDDGWDDHDATVVCRELGFLQDGVDPMAITGYQLTTVRLPVFGDAGCSGSEMYFDNCTSSFTSTFPPNTQCTVFAGVNCSDPSVTPSISTELPITTSTIDLISTTPLQTSTMLGPQSSLSLTPMATPTQTPTSIPNATDNTLLAAVIGAIGGSVVLLLLLILILFIVILLRRNQNSEKYDVSPENNVNGAAMGHTNGTLPSIPMETLEKSTKVAPPPSRTASTSDYDHVLLNPLYTHKSRSRSNTQSSNQPSIVDESGYAEIKGMVRKKSPLEEAREDKADGYSVPIDTISQRSHSPNIRHDYSALTEPNNEHLSQPVVDDQGYAALTQEEEHVYDDMTTHVYDDMSTTSNPGELKINLIPSEEILAASPYEMPITPSYELSSGVLKSALLSVQNKFDKGHLSPDISLTAPPEYGELEHSGASGYESPIEIRGSPRSYESPHEARNGSPNGYADPIEAVDGIMAHDYENPLDMKNGVNGYENAVEIRDGSVELPTIPEYATLDHDQ